VRSAIVKSYTAIWRGVHRLGPVLGSFGADPGDVRTIFLAEKMVNAGGTSALIWVAFEPDLHHARLPRSPRGNPSTPIPSSGGPCINTAGSRSTRTARGSTGMPAGGPAWSAWPTAAP